MNICRPCGYGKYQPEEGSFSCRLCGIGKTTRTKVAVSEEECRDECADGKQLAEDGTCEPCMLGTYRKKGLHLSCERCPDKTTTPRYSQILKLPIQSRLTSHKILLNLFIDLISNELGRIRQYYNLVFFLLRSAADNNWAL